MKTITLIIASTFISIAAAQSNLPVYLDPNAESPQIGILEVVADAVPADWPVGAKPLEGWQPIYYRGVFETYVHNNDIAKDLTAKPGSYYYFEPNRDAIKLSIATEKDRIDIISVDTHFCKVQLETILVGYIQGGAVEARQIVQSLPNAASGPAENEVEVATIRELRGKVRPIGMIAKNRTGLKYRLDGADGKPVALLDLSQLPDRINIEQFENASVIANGSLKTNDNGDTIILVVQSLKVFE